MRFFLPLLSRSTQSIDDSLGAYLACVLAVEPEYISFWNELQHTVDTYIMQVELSQREEAANTFHDIAEAAEVLGDSEKRRRWENGEDPEEQVR